MARIVLVHLVNRTTDPLDVMFDGVPEIIPPGYRRVEHSRPDKKDPDKPMLDAKGKPMVEVEFVALRANGIEDMPEGRDPEGVACEYAAAEAYIRQHPIMGTMDPNSTDAKATSYLLGVVEWGDNIAHAEQSDSWELLDRSLLPADRQHVELSNIPGARRKPNSKSVNAARVEANRRRDMHMALSRREVGSGVFDPAGMGIRGYRQPGEK